MYNRFFFSFFFLRNTIEILIIRYAIMKSICLPKKEKEKEINMTVWLSSL